MGTFQRAERKKAKLRLALCGPSGSGKTYSALLIAKGIVGEKGKIAVIDTENRSSELYADNPKIGVAFDVAPLAPPFSPEKYVSTIKLAAKEGYDIVVVDSLSHAWMGEGGMLDRVDTAAKGLQGNTFAAWKAVRPVEKEFLSALTQTDIHIIATMRTKTAWEVQKDEKTGKSRPIKLGLAPEQRSGLEFEFSVVLDLSVDGNVASSSKDRTDMFRGEFFVPTEETGKKLLQWLNSGADIIVPEPDVDALFLDKMQGYAKKLGKDAYFPIVDACGYKAAKEITDAQAREDVLNLLTAKAKEMGKE